ncbi:serine hydrolase domain-containing protein [Asticcacaulis sp. EMRT-3]|uniref:serine hydrolase domain-containing protein n=1 Tax=Asticcacaulis sp. EMRT-3 TaxID=3040349 RepID=UPI0024AF722F|nr:serine hydrolase domain-containing protein [Asticcacaulis sp. EMRT-3]MDI7776066.1 serine hydrolase domain-containing protein [Asticcacaulis sp. EMRT-3]
MADTSLDISGLCPPPFAAVREAFAANFAAGKELGARFTAQIAGETVVDLWGGHAGRPGTRAFDDETLTPIFSTGKAVMALMIARLVDQGKLDYEATVANYWPEFGQNGKAGITLGQLISHQGGLSGFSPPQDPSIWFDVPATLKALCEQAPLWTPGEGSGYHPIAGGYLLGEVFRRADGRSLGTALREDIAAPFGIEVMIGTPDVYEPRIAHLQKPSAPPDLGPIDAIKRAAFLDKGSAPAGKGSADWRRMEIPSANAHATSLGLARLMSVVANGGVLDGRSLISPETLSQAMRERVYGQDRVLPYRLSWGAGFLRNKGIAIYGPNPNAVGHSGWGGSCALADPERKVSAAYVMNKQSHWLIGDPRPVSLIDAFYGCL